MANLFDLQQYRRGIENEKTYKQLSDEYTQYTTNKEFSKPFISQIALTLKDKQETGNRKFYALRLLRDCTATFKGAIINDLANSRELMGILRDFGLFNCQDQDDDRGYCLFERTDSNIGIHFLRIVLELIYILADKFKKDSKGNPTRFKTTFDELKEQGVKFPSDFLYFPQPADLKPTKPELQQQKQQPQLNKPAQEQQSQFQQQEKDKNSLIQKLGEIQVSMNEDIEMIYDTLRQDDCEPVNVLDIIDPYSNSIDASSKNLDKVITQLKQISNDQLPRDQQTQIDLLKEFASKFNKLYRDLLQNDDTEIEFKKFRNETFAAAGKVLGRDTQTPQAQREAQQKKQQQDQKQQQEIQKQQQIERQKEFERINKEKQELQKQIEEQKQIELDIQRRREQERKQTDFQSQKLEIERLRSQLLGDKQSQFSEKQVNRDVEDEQRKIQQLLGRAPDNEEEQRKPSYLYGEISNKDTFLNEAPYRGSLDVNESYLRNYNDQRNSYFQEPDIMRLSNQELFMGKPIPEKLRQTFGLKSMEQQQINSQLKFTQPIPQMASQLDYEEQFDTQTNLSFISQPGYFGIDLQQKQYSGRVCPYQRDQFYLVQEYLPSIREEKRWKVACLTKRGALIDKLNIQIGAVNSLVYNSIAGCNYHKTTIFVGNKLSVPIQGARVRYEGDQSLTVWVKPQKLNETIPPGEQIKQEVIINTNKTGFRLCNGVLEFNDPYNFEDRIDFVIPFCLVTLMDFKDIDHRIFKPKWRQRKNDIVRSDVVPLNRKIIKDATCLLKYFNKLIEMVPYSNFHYQQIQGKFISYKLGGVFDIQNQEFLIKFVIQADYRCVIKLISKSNLVEQLLHTLVFLLCNIN